MARGKKAGTNEGSAPMVNLVLNKSARKLFGEATSVRVRQEGRDIMVLPSTRTKGISNLPKTDVLVPLRRTTKVWEFVVALKDVDPNTSYAIHAEKYKWTRFSICAANEVGKNMPAAETIMKNVSEN